LERNDNPQVEQFKTNNEFYWISCLMLYIFRYVGENDILLPIGDFSKLFEELADETAIAAMKGIINKTINKVKRPNEVDYNLYEYIKDLNVILEYRKLHPVDLETSSNENKVKIEYNEHLQGFINMEQEKFENEKIIEKEENLIKEDEKRNPNYNNIRLSANTLNIINNNHIPGYNYAVSGEYGQNKPYYVGNPMGGSGLSGLGNLNGLSNLNNLNNINDLFSYSNNRPNMFSYQQGAHAGQAYPNPYGYMPNMLSYNNILRNTMNASLGNAMGNAINNAMGNTMGNITNPYNNQSNQFQRNPDISNLLQHPNFNPNDLITILGMQPFLNLMNQGYNLAGLNPFMYMYNNLALMNAANNSLSNIFGTNMNATPGVGNNLNPQSSQTQNTNIAIPERRDQQLVPQSNESQSINNENFNINQILSDLENYKNKHNINLGTNTNNVLLGKKRPNEAEKKSNDKAGGANTISNESSGASDNNKPANKRKRGNGGGGAGDSSSNFSISNSCAEHFLEKEKSLPLKAELEKYLPYYERDKLEICQQQPHTFMKEHFPEMYRIDNFYIHIKQRNNKIQKYIRDYSATFDRSLTLFNIEDINIINETVRETDALKIWDPNRISHKEGNSNLTI
jgi:hypothetical protein